MRDALVVAGAAAVALLHALIAPRLAVGGGGGDERSMELLGEELKATTEAPAIRGVDARRGRGAGRRGPARAGRGGHGGRGAGRPGVRGGPQPLVRGAEALSGAAMALLDPNHPDRRAGLNPWPPRCAIRVHHPRSETRMAVLLWGAPGPREPRLLLIELVPRARSGATSTAAIDALGTLGAESAAGARASTRLSSKRWDRPMPSCACAPRSPSRRPAGRPRETSCLRGSTAVTRWIARRCSLRWAKSSPKAPSTTADQWRDCVERSSSRPVRSGTGSSMRWKDAHPWVRGEGAGRDTNTGGQAELTRRRPAKQHSWPLPGEDATTASATARALLADADSSVRAHLEQPWALGTLGDGVGCAAARGDGAAARMLDAAPDAVAAVGRIAARARAVDLAARSLCPLGADPRPNVRAKAFAGLALAGARCQGGEAERAAVADDSSEDVRAAAMSSYRACPRPGRMTRPLRSLRATTTASGAVATRCRSHAPVPAHSHPALIYLVAKGATTPHPAASYVMLLADGTLHAGTTDRRGADRRRPRCAQEGRRHPSPPECPRTLSSMALTREAVWSSTLSVAGERRSRSVTSLGPRRPGERAHVHHRASWQAPRRKLTRATFSRRGFGSSNGGAHR